MPNRPKKNNEHNLKNALFDVQLKACREYKNIFSGIVGRRTWKYWVFAFVGHGSDPRKSDPKRIKREPIRIYNNRKLERPNKFNRRAKALAKSKN